MPVYAVSQVAGYLRDMVERDGLVRDIWVSGEVANRRTSGAGHDYFTLSDGRGSLRCVMFSDVGGHERLADGAAVIAHGRVSLYVPRGDLQLIVDLVQPEGAGELQLRLEELKRRLRLEGLFDESRKRPLPRFPRRVGVVTSPSGAVWHDIRNVVARRYPLVELVLAPASVQGEDAAASIVDGLSALGSAGVDVMLLARGGGSLEDLSPFNEESVARAIFASPAPVVTGVGHETDVTISDLVADRRAPTPSAAAELVVPDRSDLAARVAVARGSLGSLAASLLSARSAAVEGLGLRVRRAGPDVDSLRLRVDDLLRTALTHLTHDLEVKAERFEGLRQSLASLGPGETLKRGYAIVQRLGPDGGEVVTDAARVVPGDRIAVTLRRGGLEAEVSSRLPATRRSGADDV
jgi:exodeoxyribonuclease VII large subunit